MIEIFILTEQPVVRVNLIFLFWDENNFSYFLYVIHTKNIKNIKNI